MGAVDDLIAARKHRITVPPQPVPKPSPTPAPQLTPTPGPTPAPTARQSAVDTFIAKRKASKAPAVSSGNPFLQRAEAALQSSTPLGMIQGMIQNVAPVAKMIASPISKALDYQQNAVIEHAYHQHDPDANMTALRKNIGIEGAYQNRGFEKVFGSNPVTGTLDQLGRGAIDTTIKTFTDPLTVETFGAGPLLRAAGISTKVGPPILKAINATPLGRMMYDFMNWGGPVARKSGTETVDFIRGAGNKASSTGMRVQQGLVERFKTITKNLSDADKKQIGMALNGEAGGLENLTATQQRIYRQLRVLTELDYKMRVRAARAIAFQASAKDLSAEDRSVLASALKKNEPPPIPAAGKRVKKPYGEPVARSKYTPEIRSENVDLNATYQDVFKGLSPQQRDTLTKAIISGKTDGLPADMVSRVQRIKDATQAKFSLAGGSGGEVTPLAPKPRYTFMPENQAAIERAQSLNQRFHDILFQVEQSAPKRTDYMPWAHQFEDHPEGLPSRTRNVTEHYDPRFEQRPDLKVTSGAQLDTGFKAMAANTGRQVQVGMIHDALGKMLDDPDVAKLFEKTMKATGVHRSDWDKIKEGWLGLIGYPRAATVSLTPRHGANILDLLVATVDPKDAPKVLADTIALATKIVKAKTIKEYAALTKSGRDLGALSGNFMERKPFFQKFSDATAGDIPYVGEKLPKGIAEKPLMGPLAGKSTGPLGAWTRGNNKIVWAIDEAAKQIYGELIVSKGEAQGLRAGGLASKRLVDYEHISPMVKVARNLAPFGTFRGSIPGAVGGAVARSPARAALYNRMTGGTFYGDKPAKGQPGVALYNPTADVGRAPEDWGAGYLRSTLGYPVQAAAVVGQEIASGEGGASFKTLGQELQDLPGALKRGTLPQPRKQGTYADAVKIRAARYMNYGDPIDLRWLLSAASAGVIEARTALQEMGLGQFKPTKGTGLERLAKDAAQQVLGVGIRP